MNSEPSPSFAGGTKSDVLRTDADAESGLTPERFAFPSVRQLVANWTIRARIAQLSPEVRSELEQATLRVAIVGIVLVYLTLASLRDGRIDGEEHQVLWVAVGMFIFSLALAARVASSDAVSVFRRFVGMFADNGVTTYCLIQMDEAGAVIIGVYLFVTFGNGFRYGSFYLHASQIMALAGFGLVVGVSNYWRSHVSLSSGVLIAILVLPFYVGVLTKRITEAKRRADAANQAKGRFLANVSHEMRTPLNGVIAMADVLRETTLTQPQREIVETMTTSAQLLLAQIEDVLDMAKIEAGRVRIEKRPFDLSTLLSSTVKVMLPQAHYKGLALRVEVSPDAQGWFVGDPHHLRQILLNLLSNAVKFTERGTVTIRARLLTKEEGSIGVRIEVEDTGIGIPNAKLGEIFEPFAQADDSITRVYGGTGLGTTIAKNLVTQMGGSIGVHSTQMVGSNFWIELPLTSSEAQPAEAELISDLGAREVIRAKAGIAVSRNGPGARILVAEDNATNQRVAQLILESGGHLVTTVNNGGEALDALESGDFDLAIFDMAMPVISGLDALKFYHFSTSDAIPVLIASANVTNEAISECMRAGASEFIAKPLRASIVLDAVERHALNRKRCTESESEKPIRSAKPAFSVVDAPTLNLQVLGDLSRLSSDPTFVDRLVRGFCDDAERLRAEILEGLSSHSYQRVRDAAHALKGGSASIGAVQLMNVAIRLEKAEYEQLASRSENFSNELTQTIALTLGGLATHMTSQSDAKRVAPACYGF
jgi:two-component system sensor histidine kinase RpfC